MSDILKVTDRGEGWKQIRFRPPGAKKMGLAGGGLYGLGLMPKVCPVCGNEDAEKCHVYEAYTGNRQWMSWLFIVFGMLLRNILFRPISIWKCKKCAAQDGFILIESNADSVVMDVKSLVWIEKLRDKLQG